MREAWTRHLPFLVYAALTLGIAYPLLGGGYIFALDHAMGPQSAAFYARYITNNADPIQSKGGFAVILTALDAIFPMEIVQRVLLFAPFPLAGLGMHRLTRERAPEAAALVGGIVYMLSPFAYVRGVSGQMGVLWAYALAPWFLSAWFAATASPSRKALATAVVLLTLTAAFQAHGAVLLALLVGIHTLVRLGLRWPDARATLRTPALLAGLALVTNAYWIIPVLFAPETTLTRITEGDRDFFSMRSTDFPSVGIAGLTLQGFWREGYETFYTATPWLLAVPALILLLSVHGLRIGLRDERTLTFATAGAVGFILGVGASSALTAPLFDLAWESVPLMRGFRDSHKFLALLALAYAALLPMGLGDAMGRLRALPRPLLRRWAPAGLALLLALAPIAAATPLFGGYHGQIGASEYPDEWQEVEAATADCAGSMVVLPWHLYMDLSWIPNHDKRVTNPAKLAFSCPVISSDNVEAGTTASQSSSASARYIEHWVTAPAMKDITTLGNLLSPVNVRFILILKEADWAAQGARLAAQDDLRLVIDNDRVQLYENLAPTAAAWRTDRIVAIDGWDDLIPLSRDGPLAGTVYVPMGDPEWTPQNGAATPVAVERSAWRTRVAEAPGRYLVVVPPPGTPEGEWRFAGHAQDATSLDATAVFDRAGGGTLTPSTYARVVLPAWGLSLIALAAVVGVAWWPRAVRR